MGCNHATFHRSNLSDSGISAGWGQYDSPLWGIGGIGLKERMQMRVQHKLTPATSMLFILRSLLWLSFIFAWYARSPVFAICARKINLLDSPPYIIFFWFDGLNLKSKIRLKVNLKKRIHL